MTTFTRSLEDAVSRSILTKRWFAGKGREISSVRLLTAEPVRIDDLPEWVCAMFSVTFTDEFAQKYFLPLSIFRSGAEPPPRLPTDACILETEGARGPCLVFDALADDRFCRGVLSSLRKSAEISLKDGILRFSASGALQKMDSGQDEPVCRLSLEQSHSSYRLGDRMIVKIYRQIQNGVNPELEIGRYLTEKAAFPNMARVGGAIEYLGEGGKTTTLAILQEFVPNDGDCWNHTLAHLKRLSEAVSRGKVPDNGNFPERMEMLGERVGQLHAVLAGAAGNSAFDPEPVSDDDWAEWMTSIERSMTETLDALRRRIASIPERHRAMVEEACAASGCIREHIKTFRPDLASIRKTRIHGDLHLGQILVTKNDFVIIDFEGEPARSLAERRRKHLPMRDVAGMLRSFSYAAQMLVQEESRANAEFDRCLTAMAEDWEHRIVEKFLSGYLHGAGDCVAIPRDRDVFDSLLKLFLLEKVLYECTYELNNRPDWIGIPTAGLIRIVKDIHTT